MEKWNCHKCIHKRVCRYFRTFVDALFKDLGFKGGCGGDVDNHSIIESTLGELLPTCCGYYRES